MSDNTPGQAERVVIYTDAERLAELEAKGIQPRETIELLDYDVQLLSVEVLDPGQRQKVMRKRYLLRF